MDDTTRRLNDAREVSADAGPLPVEDAETSEQTAVLRDEIAETRAQMSDTINAIEEKLRPSAIVANATERVKAATTERARAMADTAGEMAHDVMDRTRETARDVVNRTRDTAEEFAGRTRDVADSLIETIRNNPFPAALIGVGLAWWAFSRMRSNDDASWQSIRGGSSRRYYNDEDTYNDGSDEFDEGYRRDSASGIGRKVADSASSIAESAREYAGETTRVIRRTGRRATDQVGQMMTQNPLLVGAGALLVGAAFGMAVPETERERQWMGETRDSLVERAQQAAGDAANRIKQTATEVADAANSVAQSVTSKNG